MAKREGMVVEEMVFQVAGQTIKMKARKKKDYWAGKPTISFYIKETSPVDINIEDKDINNLRSLVLEELKKKMSMTWEKKILVRVGISRFDSRDHKELSLTATGRASATTGLEVSFTLMEEGRDPAGKVFHRHPESGMYPGPIMDADDKKQKDGSSLAVIDDTLENREALNNVIKAVNGVRDMLADFLRPKAIAATLAKVIAGGGPLQLGSGS